MNSIKILFLGLTLLTSTTLFAQKKYRAEVSIDWDRIERGLTTGDFSCRGNCAKATIDWKETWRTLSGKNFKDKKKQNLAYCISEYQKSKNALDEIETKKCDMANEQATQLAEAQKLSLNVVHQSCVTRLGNHRAEKLKASIFEVK